MSRAIVTAGALLASASLAQAGDHAKFSPDLKDASVAASAASPPAPTAVAETVAPARGKSSRRRTRLAKGKAPAAIMTAALKPALPDGAATLTIGAIPAPLPPNRGDTAVSEAVATLEVPPVHGGNTEAPARTPHQPAASLGDGPREAPSETVSEMLARHAMANGVPLKLAQAVVRIESRGNPRASNHGALGLMQIKYGTARAVGFAGPAVGLFVAETNLRYGMKILGEAFRAAHGDTCGALMRYQSGHYATHMSRANRAYCNRARSFMAGA